MIEQYRSAHEYFAGALEEVIRARRMEVSEDVRAYLARLLAHFAQASNRASLGEPLSQLLERAVAEVVRARRRVHYQGLGDVTLFVGGFFSEVYERRGVSARYVQSMGQDAYARVAALTRGLPRPAVAEEAALFDELARRFEDWSLLLGELRARTAIGAEADLAGVFERWSQSPRAAHVLRFAQRGLVPTRGPKDSQ